MSILILALDTSHQPGSIALAYGSPEAIDGQLCKPLPRNESTGRSFALQIRDLLNSIGARPRDVGLVACDIGPGSFTGLRIAATFSKTFAYATGADVLGISSMDVVAHQASASRPAGIERLWTLVDAHRDQLFAALYGTGDAEHAPRLFIQQAPKLIGIDLWCTEIQPGDVVTGPVVDRLGPRLPAWIERIEAGARTPSAQTVAQLAWRNWQGGARDDLWGLRPFYLRQSAAEERQATLPPV